MAALFKQKNYSHIYIRQFFATLLLLVSMHQATRVWAQTDQGSDETFSGKVRLVLPEFIQAVPGVELNLYFDNVCLVINPANYVFDVTCSQGMQQAERWSYTPKADDANDYPFVLEIRDESNTVIARAKSTLQVVAANAGATEKKTVLMIGDSLTAWSIYPQHLLDMCQGESNPKITLVGSHQPEYKPRTAKISEWVRHEGYSGWRTDTFTTRFTGIARTGLDRRSNCGSPFIYVEAEGKPKLDFGRYCREYNNGNVPDFVTLFLGCNDTMFAKDENIEATIDGMLEHYDLLLEMILSDNKDTRIGVIMPVPPAATQDAFGTIYKSGLTRWQYKRNQHRTVERIIERYGGREEESISLIPAYANLDTFNSYPRALLPTNAHSPQKVERLHNGVHPSKEGYFQIGDSIYCWIKACLSQDETKR